MGGIFFLNSDFMCWCPNSQITSLR
ncbi:hypothetical protein [Alteromonas salexigens]